ncbi:DUF2975 domain-containing protein [Sphingomonas azotifigens]|uniref:DUF2975 domain-containing protein n=1 Tax=Sphingomonas azotifigens TaxID=330920 RepID=UPI0009FD31E6|nr:DUF2975 domain-containing protein [Sphingomonas azotifigens]
MVRILLIGMNLLNWALAAGFGALLVLLFAAPATVAPTFAKFGSHAAMMVRAGAATLGIGLVSVVAAHMILTRLTAMVDSVATGRPFTLANADRLRTMAWALLAFQLLDLAYGVLAIRMSAATGRYFGWSPGIGGWLAVVLLLVLARVFRQGAAMQDEVEATV